MASVEYVGARRTALWTPGRLRIAGAVALLALWEAAGLSGLFFRDLLPSTWRILQAMGDLLTSREFYTHVGVTVAEILIAFAIGTVLGTAAGLILGISRRTGDIFEPFIHYLAPTPKIVFLPILLVLFGVGMGSKIALGAISSFFPMALNIAAGVRQVSPVLLRVGRTFSLSRWQTIRMIYLPALVPPIASGLRIGLGVSIVGCAYACGPDLHLRARGAGQCRDRTPGPVTRAGYAQGKMMCFHETRLYRRRSSFDGQ